MIRIYNFIKAQMDDVQRPIDKLIYALGIITLSFIITGAAVFIFRCVTGFFTI